MNIVLGEPPVVRPVTRLIDQARVDRYALAAHDPNPIHRDTPEAAVGPFGRPVAHGIVHVEPQRADRALAKRLGVKAGELVMYLRQVDYGTEGEPLLLSEEFHLADAFEFSVVRRGPGRRTG